MTLRTGLRYVHTISSGDFDSTPWLNKQGLFCLAQILTAALQRTGWKKTSCDDIVSGSLFEYCGKVPIEGDIIGQQQLKEILKFVYM